MLILLPPSETKRDGGVTGSALDLGALSFPELTAARRSALRGLRSVSKSVSASMSALRLGTTQRFEIDRNRAVSVSPVMPAIDRYTGVLYDALDAASLSPSARKFLSQTTIIHSALFGLIRAEDSIPAYRFSHDTRVPGTPLGSLWREANAAVLAAWSGLILDLRSESYVHLGSAPVREGSFFVRVVSEDASGRRRALNHFNKHGKGALVRALAQAGEDHSSVDSLLDWATRSGVRIEPGVPGELDLVV
ncbi:MAG TPA: peroxide stress protein YaaA [Galbitalea sp.]